MDIFAISSFVMFYFMKSKDVNWLSLGLCILYIRLLQQIQFYIQNVLIDDSQWLHFGLIEKMSHLNQTKSFILG